MRKTQNSVVQATSPKGPSGNPAPLKRRSIAERMQSTASSIGFSWLVKDDPDAEGEVTNEPQRQHGRHEGGRNSVKFDV